MKRKVTPRRHHFTVECKHCGSIIAVREDPSAGRARFLGPCVIQMRCDTCGATEQYPAAAVRSTNRE
jgi:ribosomal protein S27E